MGKVVSKATRPLKNYNVENRAAQVLQSKEPRPAPRHPSSVEALKSVAQDNTEYLAEQKEKNQQLDDFLKKVKVDSTGKNPEIVIKSGKELPTDRKTKVPAEYGMPDPDSIPEGRSSLRQSLEFISSHHLHPLEHTAERIAADYKLDPVQVQHILTHFQTLELHVPQALLKKHPKLIDALPASTQYRQSVEGMQDVLKLEKESKDS